MRHFKATLKCVITYTDYYGSRKYIPQGQVVDIRHVPKGQGFSDLCGMFSLTDEDVYIVTHNGVHMDIFPEEFTEKNIHD